MTTTTKPPTSRHDGALFTSTRIPPSPGLDGSSELPFGSVLSSLAPLRDGGPDERGHGRPPPPLCLTCLSYLNPFCPRDPRTGRWTCSICGSDGNVAEAAALDALEEAPEPGPGPESEALSSSSAVGAVTPSNVVEFRQRVADDGGHAQGLPPAQEEDSICYVFVLDSHVPPSEIRAVVRTIRSLFAGDGDGDGALDPARASIGLVVFDKTVGVYQLGLGGVASADVYAAPAPAAAAAARGGVLDGWTDGAADRRAYLAAVSGGGVDALERCAEAHFGDDPAGGGTLADGGGNASSDSRGGFAGTGAGAAAATGSTPPSNGLSGPGSRKEMLRLRREERLRREGARFGGGSEKANGTAAAAPPGIAPKGGGAAASSAAFSSTRSRLQPSALCRRRRSERERIRCTGEAVRLAVELIATSVSPATGASHRTGRVVLFTNGCPNRGPGSVVSPSASVNPTVGASSSSGGGRGRGSSGSTLSASTGVGGPSTPGRPHRHRHRHRHRRKHRLATDVVDPVSLASASEYFTTLGRDAFELGIGIDVFCTGTTSLGVPAMQALTGPGEGYVLTHPSLCSGEAGYNLGYVLGRTHMSRTVTERQHESAASATSAAAEEGDPSTNGAADSAAAAAAASGGLAFAPLTINRLNGCLLDVRTSPFITPTSVVGPGEVEYDDDRSVLPNERPIFAHYAALAARQGLPTYDLPSKEMLAVSLTRVRMGRFDPKSTHSVMAMVNDELRPEDRYGVFQFVARFVTSDGSMLVTRVFTHRLPVAQNVPDFIDCIQEKVIPVVLGREAVYRSMVGRGATGDEDVLVVDRDRDEDMADDARRDVDATVHLISSAYRLLRAEVVKKDSASGESVSAPPSSLNFAFPPELAGGLRMLHHLRRGPMLGTGPLQSVDDRAVTRSLYLRLPLEDCSCLMAPSVWSCRVDGSSSPIGPILESVPAVTLALWDNCVLAADHYDNLFVWSGRKTLQPEYDKLRKMCKDHLLERSKKRFPRPQLHMLNEGDSMSRRLTTRLAPSHGDPPDHQVAYFPALASFSPTELTMLRDKFRFYDPNSDSSFRRWFWDVASASSKAGNEGVSLCE